MTLKNEDCIITYQKKRKRKTRKKGPVIPNPSDDPNPFTKKETYISNPFRPCENPVAVKPSPTKMMIMEADKQKCKRAAFDEDPTTKNKTKTTSVLGL